MLEQYNDHICMLMEQCLEDSVDQIKHIIVKMEEICGKHQVVSHYVTQAKTWLATETFNKNGLSMKEQDFESTLAHRKKLCEEPIKILEDCLVSTLRQISVKPLPENFTWDKITDLDLELRTHPFLDTVMFQLGRKAMHCNEFMSAQRCLDQLV